MRVVLRRIILPSAPAVVPEKKELPEWRKAIIAYNKKTIKEAKQTLQKLRTHAPIPFELISQIEEEIKLAKNEIRIQKNA